MGRWFEHLLPEHIKWMREQHLFFVGTAAPTGLVNVSPKGHARETFAVLGPKTVAYLDLTGSGTETFAHSEVSPRITLLFLQLESGAPKIMRLHGTCRCELASDFKKTSKKEVIEQFSPAFVDRHDFLRTGRGSSYAGEFFHSHMVMSHMVM